MRLVIPVLAFLLLAPAARGLELAPGEPLTQAHVARLLAPFLPAKNSGRRIEIQILAPALPLANPARSETRIEVVGFAWQPRRPFFRLDLWAGLPDGTQSRLAITGRLRELRRVPVPALRLAAGTRLTPALLEEAWLPVAALGPGIALDADQLIGFETRRALAPGRPIRLVDLRTPRLVRRGELVTVVYRRPGLELALAARALEDGDLGRLVRFTNPESGATFRARVTGRRRAEAVGSEG